MSEPLHRISGEYRGPVPIVFGVTGHRDLRPEDIEALEGQAREIFLKFARKHPRTPLTLLSPLAEGADRLVARVALEVGVRLIVPMPLAKEQYERDFQTPASREEFHGLLVKSAYKFRLPLLPGFTEQAVQVAGEARNHHYAQVGAYIARHSHILITLWDNQGSNKTGGTAQVVNFKLRGIPEPYGPRPNPLDPVENGPVYHIITPRVSNPQVADALQARWLYLPAQGDNKQAAKACRRIFARIETFNRDAVRWKLWPQVERQNGKSLFSDAMDIEKVKSSQTAKGILDWFTVADRLALRFQGRDLWALQGLAILGIAAAVLLQMSSGDVPKAWSSGCLVALYGLYALTLWQGFHNKYLDYRALAEGLRVQLFWWLAGIQESVADHYLRKQRSELDWTRQAIRMRTIQSTSDIMRLQRKPLRPERADLVFRCWVQDQARYFSRSSSRNRLKSRLISWVGYGAIAVPAVLIVSKRYLDGEHPLLVSLGLFLIVAASLGVYAKVQAYAEHSNHYERMHQIFRRAEEKLRELLKPGQNREGESQNLLMDLGKEALIENSDWVLLHRERQPEPKG